MLAKLPPVYCVVMGFVMLTDLLLGDEHYVLSNRVYTAEIADLESVNDLPEFGNLRVIVGRIADSLHVRIFSGQGQIQADKSEVELISGEALDRLKSLIANEVLPDIDAMNATTQETIVQDAFRSVGLEFIGSVEIIAYEGGASVVNVPETIGAHSVVAIGRSAFAGNTYLKSVSIARTVGTIGENAFHDCENLRNVSIESGVYVIGASAFKGCDKLERVEFHDSPTLLGKSVFKFCESLHDVDLGENLVGIGAETFWGCESLVKLTIPKSVAQIGEFAFFDCYELESLYFEGERPKTTSSPMFLGASNTTVYFFPNNSSSWEPNFHGRTTRAWDVRIQSVSTYEVSEKERENRTAFFVIQCTGSPGLRLVVESMDSTTPGNWSVIGQGTLADDDSGVGIYQHHERIANQGSLFRISHP